MNLAAFAGVAFLRNATGSENLDDYSGLVRRSPGFTICMAIVMFSLLGLPPLSGFAAKVTIFISLIQAKMFALLLIGVLNTVLSLFYYLRVVKVMTAGGGTVGSSAAGDFAMFHNRVLLRHADPSRRGIVFPVGRIVKLGPCGRDCFATLNNPLRLLLFRERIG